MTEKNDRILRHCLLDSRFSVEILDSRQPGLGYHRQVKKDFHHIHRIPKLLKDQFYLFHSLIFPVFLKRGKKYSLVARYWVLYYVIEQGIRHFPAIVFTDPSLKDEVLALEQLENDLLFSGSKPTTHVSVPVPKTKKTTDIPEVPSGPTKARANARKTGRICPFCDGPLAVSDKNQKVLNENPGDGPHRVTCGYRRNAPAYCPFTASLTDAEIKLFKDREEPYETENWITHVPEKYCPECRDDVYRRTIHKDDGSIEVHERCRKLHQTRDRTCSWDKKKRGPQ